MKFRKHVAATATAAVVASAFALAAPAHAAYTQQPDDPSFTPAAGDLIGVGSDTTQIAVHQVAEGWNSTGTPSFKIASFAATGGGTVPLPTAEINRPNGSGAGKALLHGAGNNADVDFARSSSAISDSGGANEITDGLQQIPFALDTLKMAVSGSVTSHAPASLTVQDLVKIYDGTYTTWDQIPGNSGGSTAAIKPMVPQSGSGTAKFFKSKLDAANGSTVTYAGTVDQTVQEHDDTSIKNDPDAIAPFSEGRANLLGGTVHLEGGFQADRAVYNVVRGSSGASGIGLGDADLTSAFSSTGYFCSPAAKPLIAQGGLKQLLTPEFGGVCGVATQQPTANFATDTTATTTGISVAATTANTADITATVSPAAAGQVDFLVDGVKVGDGQTQSGVATFHATGLAPGAHSFQAKFTHDFGTAYTDSQSSEVSGTVKSASSVALSFSATPTYGKPTVITATTTGIADGETVGIKVGSDVKKMATVTAGIAKLNVLASRPAGTYSVVATYNGNADAASSSATKTLVIAKAAPVISETFPLATQVGKPGKGVVKVAIANSTLKPTGTVKILMGTKVLKTVTLVNGQVTVTLPKLSKGKHTLTIKYLGSANVKPGSKSFVITQK